MNSHAWVWGANKRTARVAGFLYLIVIVSGFFSLIYVPSHTIVPDDVAATVNSINNSKLLFQFGILSGCVCYSTFLLLPLALYELLSPSGKQAAGVMVAFAVASVPISFMSLGHRLDILTLLSGAHYLQAFSTDQLHAQVQLSLDRYGNGLRFSEILWGLWLLPLGILVFKSDRLPKALGILLILGCFGYLINSLASMLYVDFTKTAVASVVTIPAGLGEIGTCLWLLTVGVREHPGTPKTRANAV
jgi:hypothetical protein